VDCLVRHCLVYFVSSLLEDSAHLLLPTMQDIILFGAVFMPEYILNFRVLGGPSGFQIFKNSKMYNII
jgi:hypothetical protein